jgi:hypothetical protein
MATKTAPRKKMDEAKVTPKGKESDVERDARLLAALLKDRKPVSSREIHDAMIKAGASDSMVGRSKRELGDVQVTRMKGEGDSVRATTGRGNRGGDGAPREREPSSRAASSTARFQCFVAAIRLDSRIDVPQSHRRRLVTAQRPLGCLVNVIYLPFPRSRCSSARWCASADRFVLAPR